MTPTTPWVMTWMMTIEIDVINQSILINGATMTSQEVSMTKPASSAYIGFLKRETHMVKVIDKQLNKEAIRRGSRIKGVIRNNNGVIRLSKAV